MSNNVTHIDKIDIFIKFVVDLFNDEFDYVIDYCDAAYYFLNGGCYELAQIIKHYFKEAEYVVRNDYEHCAILYKGKIYDAYDCYDDEKKKELIKSGINKNEIYKRVDDFKVFTKEEIDNFERPFGRNIKIEGKSVTDGIIDEIKNIESIRVGNI